MKRSLLTAVALSSATAAWAQEQTLSVTAGVRAWRTDWTTFSYYDVPKGLPNEALTQKSANEKVAMLPSLGVRYGRWLASFSAFTSTSFGFDDGTTDKRSEWDASVGYSLLPGLTGTLGYKKVQQRGSGGGVYRPAGPVLGLSANAPIGEGLSLYGSLGLGRLKTPSGDKIDFEATYALTEVGLTYALNADMPRWTLTGGYRMQVMRSKEAFGSQDGRDTTQGMTLGLLVTF